MGSFANVGFCVCLQQLYEMFLRPCCYIFDTTVDKPHSSFTLTGPFVDANFKPNHDTIIYT